MGILRQLSRNGDLSIGINRRWVLDFRHRVSNRSVSQSQTHEHNWTALVLPVGSCFAVVWMFGTPGPISWENMPRNAELFAALLGPFVLLSGAFLLWRHSRPAYWVVAAGAFLPLPWLFMTESRAYANSWIALNASWSDPDPSRYMRYCELRIVSVALLLMTFIWAGTRSLPARLQLFRRRLNCLTWPAIGITLILIVCWFARYAFPYRQPVIIDGAEQELGLLHVEKNGTAFHETRISVYRNGRYYIARNDRRLFRYSFMQTAQEGFLTAGLRTKLGTILALPELKRTLDAAPPPLRTRRGEGWYTVMGSFKTVTFTTENAIPPPRELTTFLNEVEREAPVGPSSRHTVRDICLGFCYDPYAGLGFVAENQRCAERPDGKQLCY